eukprot:gene13952-biopygen3562
MNVHQPPSSAGGGGTKMDAMQSWGLFNGMALIQKDGPRQPLTSCRKPMERSISDAFAFLNDVRAILSRCVALSSAFLRTLATGSPGARFRCRWAVGDHGGPGVSQG